MLEIKNEKLNYIYEVVKIAKKLYLDDKVMLPKDKGSFDLVTNIDLEVEEFIIKKILEKYPDDTIISEETNALNAVNKDTWTIDPIDGTYNMANNCPFYGIQVSMYHEGEIYLGLIYLPFLDECYYALKNEGAYLNHERLKVQPKPLDHAILSFGDLSHKRPLDMELETKILVNIKEKIARVRFYGAASLDFSFAASRKTDGVVIFTKNKWDINPGIIICQEAGLLVKDLEGNHHDDSRCCIAVNSEELYEEIVKAAKA